MRSDRAGLEILLSAWQVSEVARRDPSNERLQAMAVNRFFKLVRRKFGITNKTDDELRALPWAGRTGHHFPAGPDGGSDETPILSEAEGIGAAMIPAIQSGNCFTSPKLGSGKMNVKSESFQ